MNESELPMFRSEEERTAFFESIKNKPFTVTEPGAVADFYPPTDPGPPNFPPAEVDKVDRHRRHQAFAMFGCKHLWKEEYASRPRADVIGELQTRVREHPAVPRVMEALKNQLDIETTLGELPAVAALKDAVQFFVGRKGCIKAESEARDKLKAQMKRHQQEIARHEFAMSAYAKSAVEAGVLKPFTAYQAGEYVLVVLFNRGEYSVSLMPLQK
jgi:hypothetical protein